MPPWFWGRRLASHPPRVESWPSVTETNRPNLYIVAGPNGAGKSTFARLFLPDYADCREFVNADLIAAGLSPFNPESLAIEAGRLMLGRIETLARSRVNFGFETTLAGRGYVPLLQRLRSEGYRIHLFFLWLPDPQLALARVYERVLSGGHFVPEEVVRRRFSRGLANLFHRYESLLDTYLVFDSSGDAPRLVAVRLYGNHVIFDETTFGRIQTEASKR
jgi:predicted ABC-type ATPase